MINDQQRISKLVANFGSYSRREVDRFIEQGKVKVNGRKAVLGQKITVKDKVEIDGKRVNFNLKHEYYLLNKPKGYISSRVDEKGKQAISLIDNYKNRNLFTVGRLDVQTTGIIIVTSDGELSNKVNSPSSNIKKTYLVWLERPTTKDEAISIQKGIELDDGYITKPTKSYKMISNSKEEGVLVKLSITEGKKNQVRRMFEATGNKVINLKRVRIGDLVIDKIPNGKYKQMTQKEMYSALWLRQKN